MSLDEQGEGKNITQIDSNSQIILLEIEEKTSQLQNFDNKNLKNLSNSMHIEEQINIKNRKNSLNSEGKSKAKFIITSNHKGLLSKDDISEKEEEMLSGVDKHIQCNNSSCENSDYINCENSKDFQRERKSSLNKIFSTTVIEKNKKAINFKVIKNRERNNSTNTIQSVNLHSNININENSSQNNVLSNLIINNCGNASNKINNYNISNNNFTENVQLENFINSNSTSSNSVNLNSINELNINNLNLNQSNNNINLNYNSKNNTINTLNLSSHSDYKNSQKMDELNVNQNFNKVKNSGNFSKAKNINISNKENLYSSENQIQNKYVNSLIEKSNHNNFNINNNLNNQNMKNFKNSLSNGKEHVFDYNQKLHSNYFLNDHNSYNLKNMQNQVPSNGMASTNSQLHFIANSNQQEFYSDSNIQNLSNNNNTNTNLRNYTAQIFPPYSTQNFPFFEKENFALASGQNFNNFNNYYPTAENFPKKRNKENEENFNFNSLYLNSANFSNGVSDRHPAQNIYSNPMTQNYLNSFSPRFNSNFPYGIPGNYNGMGMNGMASPLRKPLRYKENCVDELLFAVEECINRGIYKEENVSPKSENFNNGNHEKKLNDFNNKSQNNNSIKQNHIQNPYYNKELNNEVDINIIKETNKNNNESTINFPRKKSFCNKEYNNEQTDNENHSSINKLNDEKSKNINNTKSSLNNNDESSCNQISEKNNVYKKSPTNDCSRLKNNLLNNDFDRLSNNHNLDLNEKSKQNNEDDLNSNLSSKHSRNSKSSLKKNEESFIDFSSCKENKKLNNPNIHYQNTLAANNRINNKKKEINLNHSKCENKYCQFDTNSKKKFVIKKEKIGNKSMLICQDCLKAYNNGKFCKFCYTTYKDNTNAHEDGKDWVQCDTVNCLSWHHIHCEEKKGNYSNLSNNLKDKDFKYYCPECKPKYEINCTLNKGKKNTANDLLLKKKRAAVKINSSQNVYSKHYDIKFKHSKSKRIKERLKLLEKNKEKEKGSETDIQNSPSNLNSRNFTSLGRAERIRKNSSALKEEGELIKRSRPKNKGSSKSLNYNIGNGFNNFNDIFVYDQRLKTKRNRINSSAEEDRDISNDIKKLNEKLNKEN